MLIRLKVFQSYSRGKVHNGRNVKLSIAANLAPLVFLNTSKGKGRLENLI